MDTARPLPAWIRFGPFEVDVRSGEMRREGRKVRIQQKPLALLILCLERPGEVVSRDEAIARLWPGGIHVGYEQGLANAVQKLRRALGDPAGSPIYIETLPRRGYRYVGPSISSGFRTPERAREMAAPGRRPSRAVGLTLAAGMILLLVFLAARGEIASGLALALDPAPAPPAHHGPPLVVPGSGEAREAYLRGRYFWDQKSVEGVRSSLAWFARARELDPGFAPASVGLADAWQFLGALGQISRDEAWRRSVQAARAALAADAGLGEAWASLAETNFRFGPPGAPAEALFRRAVGLSPESAVARQRFGNYLASKGHIAEGLDQMRRAHDLDPLSLHINVDLAALLYSTSRREEAMEQIRRTMELDPGYAKTHYILAAIHHEEGRLTEAVAAMRRAVELAPDVPKFVEALGIAAASAGRRRDAEEALHLLRGMSPRLHVEPSSIRNLEARIAGISPVTPARVP